MAYLKKKLAPARSPGSHPVGVCFTLKNFIVVSWRFVRSLCCIPFYQREVHHINMETIFNLLPTAPTKQRKPKMYRSKHNPKGGIDSTFNVRNKAAGTMGRTNNRKTTESFTRSRRDKGVIPKKNGSCLHHNTHLHIWNGDICHVGSIAFKCFSECCIMNYNINILFLCFFFSVKRFMRPDRVPRRQKVPLRNDKPVMGLKTTKDFLVANAVENILAGNPAFCMNRILLVLFMR